MLPAVGVGEVPSMRVLYIVEALLPQASVAVTVTTAEQVPIVEAVLTMVEGQSSLAVVAAMAAASAAAAVG